MALALDGSVSGGNGGADDSVTLTTTAAGQICVVVTVNNTTVASISDSAGLTYSKRASGGQGSTIIELWSATSASAQASNSITITYSASASFARVIAFGVSGSDPLSPWDSNASLPNTGISDPRTVSTTANDTFVIGAFRMSSTSDPGPGAGYTEIASGGTFTLAEYQIVASPQTNLSVTIGTGVGDANGGIGDALKAAAGGGGAADRPRLIGGRLVNKGLLLGGLAA